MKEMKSIKFICNLLLAFTCFIDFSLTLENYNYLRYLEGNSSSEIYITFEFPFSCGSSYITKKKICNDITNELLRRNLNIVPKLVGKNASSARLDYKDPYFNIWMENNNGIYLLGTTNPSSKFYSENLEYYPERFVKFLASPRDEDFTKKLEFARVIQQRIIENL